MKQTQPIIEKITKHYTLKSDGVAIAYRMKNPWNIFFSVLGYATQFSLPINNVLNFELKNHWYGSQLKLSAYRYKIGKNLNVYNLPIVWGLKRNDLIKIIGDFEKIIALNKECKNVALCCVSKKQIKTFYAKSPNQIHKTKKSGISLQSNRSAKQV